MRVEGKITIGFFIWTAAALLAGASGALAVVPMPVPQLILFALSAAVLVLLGKNRACRLWVSKVDIRLLALVHLCRFVGIYFLVLHARGGLPYAFAVPGGWGDIAVATSAVGIVFVPADRPWGRRCWLAWNALGLMDILFVALTAAKLGVAHPGSMRPLTELPLSLLPTLVVPMIIATHVLIFARLGLWVRFSEEAPAPVATQGRLTL